MKSWKLILIIIIQVALLILLLLAQWKINVQEKIILSFNPKVQSIIHEKDKYKTIISHFYTEEGNTELNYTLVNINEDSLSLKDLLNEKENILVFKYHAYNCSDCIQKVMEQLQEFKYKDKLIILSNYNTLTSMVQIRRKYDLDINNLWRVHEISEEDITPCLYILDKNLRKYNFIYISIDDNVLPSYLNSLEGKL